MIADTSRGARNPYCALLLDAIEAAYHVGASDIHIEPTKDDLRIRFRILGDLRKPWKTLPLKHRQSFINEAKRVLNLSIAISGRAQDGMFSYPELNLKVRVSLLPVKDGEKIVLRLQKIGEQFSIGQLGLDADTYAGLERALEVRCGVIIFSGGTGSGKTTTVYRCLAELNRVTRNLVTIEDPIEYEMEGVNQVKVDSKMTFAGALRAILRQDPDVILVGEIRDEETANLCFKAASTGHLVLSTLHANSAGDVVTRLLGLGVEPYLIRANLKYAAAQRLVKTLCDHCKVREVAGDGGAEKTSGKNFFVAGGGCAAKGCDRGYRDRTAILEYMDAKQIAEFGQENFSGKPTAKISLREACLLKAQSGIIDVREVDKIA